MLDNKIIKKGFFAYSSQPVHCGQFIELAIKKINSNGNTKLDSWRKLEINGKFIINEVLKEIDNSDYFCADLTGMNDNVLFEIGYALSKNKPIWLIIDNSHIESTRKFREFNLLSTVGYSSYTNSENIVSAFNKSNPFDIESLNYEELIGNKLKEGVEKKPLLFLKSQHDTDYNQSVVNEIKNTHKLSFILDDASEDKIQSFSWYLENLSNVPALLAEFSSTSRSGWELQNSKCSLISGIAIGLDLRVLMIAEEPYTTPLDYREILKKFNSTNSVIDVTKPFLSSLKEEFFTLPNKTNYQKLIKERSKLEKIQFGEYQAEHEVNEIQEYYIDTLRVKEFIKNEYNVVVGRKGSGKTAALFYLKSLLDQDARNNVCIIKPVSFEIDALIHLLSTLNENYEKSNLIESAWKFLIYTEVGKSIYKKIKNRPAFSLSQKESEFTDFIETNKEIVLDDFSIRLEKQLEEISSESFGSDISSFKIKVSELMHSEIIAEIRNYIKNVIPKDKKIIVLIDNLDKSWSKKSKLDLQSAWILGLLGVTGRIINELSGNQDSTKGPNFHLTIFLRSDIFNHVLKVAREPDKIECTKINWEDKSVLFRIIEERNYILSNSQIVPQDFWENYIVKEVDNIPVQSFIYDKIIPRPRDLIFFFREAREAAIQRGHIIIDSDDVIKAYDKYSAWVFTSVIVENGITIEQMENFLYQFVGFSQVINENDIVENMIKSNIELDIDYFINHLVSLSILGREIHANEFAFDYDFDNVMINRALAERMNVSRYKIHNAFAYYLDCEML
jgi:energy-coupling factor transporter ATP-binding protein EcfA2